MDCERKTTVGFAGGTVEDPQIAPASIRDLRDFMRLERVCFERDAWPLMDIIGALLWPGEIRLRAVLESKVVGMAVAEPSWRDDISMITTIGVDPQYHRRGIGSKLLAECESLLPAKRIRLTVREDNIPAIRLYERFGYICLSRIPGYYRDGQAGLVMEKVRC